MADGSAKFDDVEVGASDERRASFASKLFGSRRNILTLLSAAGALGLFLIIVINFTPYAGLNLVEAPFLVGLDSWLWLATASSFALLLPLLLLLLDPPDNMAKGPSRALPFATLGILVVLAIASAVSVEPLRREFAALDGRSIVGTLSGSAALATFFAFFGTALLARVWNAALFAQFAHKEFIERQKVQTPADNSDEATADGVASDVREYRREQGHAEALSAIIATVAVFGIAGLALIAGGWTETTRIGKDVGLVLAGVIFGIFAVVIIFDWLADFPPVRTLSRALRQFSSLFRPLAAFYNLVDLLLVRIGAHVAGAGHTSAVDRYLVIASTQICLAVMAWNLPDPLGLIPAFIGFTLALSVSRLWAWVEEDRNLALITQYRQGVPQRVGFKEDYRDEAIFGFMFVLVIVPIALKQADAGRLFDLQYFEAADHNDLVPWFVYFCIEIAKALPIVDWADIYLSPENFDTLKPTEPWGQHATFLARALVDLVLVAALLQAISITLRNRQQKSLYASGQIDRLDELVERVELKRAISRPEAEWFNYSIDFRRYNPDRLRELHANTRDPTRKAFIEKVFELTRRRLASAFDVMESLSRRRASLKELKPTFEAVIAEHRDGKRKLEPLDFEGVFDALRDVEGLKALKIDMLDFAEQIGAFDHTENLSSLAQLLELIIFSSRRDQFQYTRVHAAKILTRIVPRLMEPDSVSTLLANLKAGREDLFGRSRFVPEQLEKALVLRLQEIGAPESR